MFAWQTFTGTQSQNPNISLQAQIVSLTTNLCHFGRQTANECITPLTSLTRVRRTHFSQLVKFDLSSPPKTIQTGCGSNGSSNSMFCTCSVRWLPLFSSGCRWSVSSWLGRSYLLAPRLPRARHQGLLPVVHLWLQSQRLTLVSLVYLFLCAECADFNCGDRSVQFALSMHCSKMNEAISSVRMFMRSVESTKMHSSFECLQLF